MYSLNSSVNYRATSGQFTNISISADNKEVNIVTRYVVSFTNSNPIIANGYIEITFPPQLKIGNFTKRSCGNNIIKGISQTAMCEIKSQVDGTTEYKVLGISDVFPTTLVANTNMSISVENITNHYCTELTSSFIIGSYTSDGFSIDYNKDNISSDFIAGALVSPGVKRKSSFTYDSTSYDFSFRIKNSLPINSQIVITFPNKNDSDEIKIIDINLLKSNCLITIGNNSPFISNNCDVAIKNNLQIVTLSNVNSEFVNSSTQIKIELSSIRNPRSLKTTQSFKIQTQRTNGCDIDVNYNDIVINDTHPAEISEISITPESFVNGVTTSYSFEIISKAEIKLDDILLITFPEEISLTSTNISLIGQENLSSGPKFTISHNENLQNVITITISPTNSCNCIPQGEKIRFQIRNLINPISLQPTGIFSFKFITYDLFTIQETNNNNNSFSITMLTPNLLQEASIKSSLNQRESVSDYTIQFKPSNVIPKNGIISIIYPIQINVIDGTCLSINGLSNDILCTHEVNLRKISLTGGFPNADFKPSLSFIKFTIKGLENKVSSDKSSTDSFKLFTINHNGYIIDQIINQLSVTFTCPPRCATCEADNLTCSTCYPNSLNPYLHFSDCITKCPKGYALDDTKTKCIKCNSICATCQETSKDSCLTCDTNSSYPFYISQLNTCVSSCIDGFYPDTTEKICLSCSSPCKNCKSATKCTSCNEQSNSNPFYLFYPLEEKCLSSCPSDVTVQSGNFCLACDTKCKTCLQTSKQCTSCYEDKILYYDDCINAIKCPSDHYIEQSKLKCIRCNENCLECGNSYNECKKCKDGLILDDYSACQIASQSCSMGYFLSEKSLCEKCLDECMSCTQNKSNCTSCNPGLALQGNKCQLECNNGYFKESLFEDGVYKSKCSLCDKNCNTCKNSGNVCTSCYSDQILYDNTCLIDCPTGYFKNSLINLDGSDTVSCEKCSLPNCELCGVNNICLTCSNFYFFFDGQCRLDCPEKFLKDYQTRSCIEENTKIYNLTFVRKFKLSGTNFVFLILTLLIIILNLIIKIKFDETYFCGSTIGMISILFIIEFYFYISYTFIYGVETFFLILAYCLVMKIFLNNVFILIYEFYTNTDREFKYWKSSEKLISLVFYVLCYLLDYKIIRLFYSRYYSIKIFKPKFENFNLIHIPYRKLVIAEIMLIFIPLNIITIFILIRVDKTLISNLWCTALENFLISFVMIILFIIDLNVNKRLNEDFYNQKKTYPEIAPYEYVKGNSKIEKKFDLNEAGNLIKKNSTLKDFIRRNSKMIYGGGVNSFMNKRENYLNLAGKKLCKNKNSINENERKNNFKCNQEKNMTLEKHRSGRSHSLDDIHDHTEKIRKNLFSDLNSQNSLIRPHFVTDQKDFHFPKLFENDFNSINSNRINSDLEINDSQNLLTDQKKRSNSFEKISRNEIDLNLDLDSNIKTQANVNNHKTEERLDTNILNQGRIFTKQYNDDKIYSRLSTRFQNLFKSFSKSGNKNEDYEILQENDDDTRLKKEISQFNLNSSSNDIQRTNIISQYPIGYLNVNGNVSTPNFCHDFDKSFGSNVILNKKKNF